MPVSYKVDPSCRCIFVEFEGVVTDQELLSVQRQIRSDPAAETGYCRLLDAVKATAFAVKSTTLRTVAQNAVQSGVSRAALVAGSDLSYGILRMYECYSGEAECRVFRDRAEALQWLNVEEHPQPGVT